MQRLLEIETYRMMALVALPLVREHDPQISAIEEETAKIARSLSKIAGLEDTRPLLTRLSRLSADVEGITARLSYRFDATRAYFALVRRRVERLREERLERLQTIEEFMERRLAPAMKTCETAARRLESSSRRLARTSDLLRTQVDVALQEQNRDLLLSMDRRARLQSRLQRILEVISIVALTYYLEVLLATVLTAVKTDGVPLNVELITGAAIPFLFGIIWLGVRWTRKTVVRRLPPMGAVALLLVAAMTVTPFLNNAATVLVMAPIAASFAGRLGYNPDPFLMAVAIGAACDFLTPIGHQCNTLVMGPGGYRFGDYWRLGLPLSLIVLIIGVPLIAFFWPF